MTTKATVPGEALLAPHSSGTAPPQIAVPPGATDCHHHIMTPNFLKLDGTPARSATADDYRTFMRRLGLSRSVVIAPSSFGPDNRCLLEALQSFGDASRAVAIVRPEVTDAELDALHRRGVRGIRLYLGKGVPPTADELRLYARRIARLGWHIQIVAARHAGLLGQAEAVLRSLDCPLVVDHFGHVPQPGGIEHPEADVIRRLLDGGTTWLKLSGVYITSETGFPDYADVDELAADFMRRSPERLLWGTDWPHPGAGPTKPDGAKLADQLARWASGESIRRQILVDNPTRLYWYE